MNLAAIKTPFLDISYRTVVAGVLLTFHIPESVLRDFESYVRRGKVPPNIDFWGVLPTLTSLRLGIPEKGKCGWDRPLNKPFHGPSRKSIIRRVKALSKQEPLVAVTEEIHQSFWDKIQERSGFYGISPGELCLSCIGYHAGLERRQRERGRPKTSFDAFERALAKESRQPPRIPSGKPASNILRFATQAARPEGRDA